MFGTLHFLECIRRWNEREILSQVVSLAHPGECDNVSVNFVNKSVFFYIFG